MNIAEFFQSKKVKVFLIGFFADLGLLALSSLEYVDTATAHNIMMFLTAKVGTYMGIQGFADAWTNGRTSSVVHNLKEQSE
jgi:hypothetical protein